MKIVRFLLFCVIVADAAAAADDDVVYGFVNVDIVFVIVGVVCVVTLVVLVVMVVADLRYPSPPVGTSASPQPRLLPSRRL